MFSHPLTKAQFEEGKVLDTALLVVVLNMKQVVIHLSVLS